MTANFGRRIWVAALTGFPFCVYKMGFGWYEYHHSFPTIGLAAMVWGALDIGVNLLAVVRPKTVAVCALANIGRWIDRAFNETIWHDILLAVDTTVTFLIVATMIWFNRLPLEPQSAATAWNLAVVCNVLSVGLDQMFRAIWRRDEA